MTHGSRTLVDLGYRRTIFIVALVVVGVCLFGLAVAVSIYVPVEEDTETGAVEQLIGAAR